MRIAPVLAVVAVLTLAIVGVAAQDGGSGAIVFVSARADGEDYEIYAMRPDGGGVRRLTRNPRSTDHEPALSPDGRRVAFVSLRSGAGNEIYVMNADGSGVRRLTRNHKGTEEHSPTWSPDGRRLAFSSERDGNGEIYVLNAVDGSGLRRLTRHPAEDRDPAWSPDGRRIAFIRGGQVHVMAADGTGVRRLTASGFHLQPAWSPDGRTLAVTAQRDGQTDYDIYTLSAADGSAVRRQTRGAAADVSPAWSPDGRSLAFASNRAGSDDIYVLRIADATVKRLTAHPDEDADPHWR